MALYLTVSSSGLEGVEVSPPPASPETPAADAHLEGTMEVFGLGGIQWQVSTRVNAATDGTRVANAHLIARGPGTDVDGRARFDLRTSKGTWTLDSARFELSPWLTSWAQRADAAGELAGWSIEGVVEVDGQGTLRPGVAEGQVQVDLRVAHLTHLADNVSLRELAAEVVFAGDSTGTLRSPPGQRVTVQSLQAGPLTFRQLRTQVTMMAIDTLRVEGGEVEAFEGSATLSPFTLRFTDAGLSGWSTTLQLRSASLASLAGLFPEVIASARGMVDGQLEVHWTPADGFVPGRGRLDAIGSQNGIEVRLKPTPGLLTQDLDPFIRPLRLPRVLGWLERRLAQPNPAYRILRDIEMGQEPLPVSELSVRLSPEGDENGRTATLRLRSRPAIGTGIEEIELDLNVTGPLTALFQLGLNEQLRIQAGTDR